MDYQHRLVFGNNYQAFPDAKAKEIAISLMGKDVYTSTLSVVRWAIKLMREDYLPGSRVEFYFDNGKTLEKLDVDATGYYDHWPQEMLDLLF